jgi:DNA-binding XRE family transcriptional regulator
MAFPTRTRLKSKRLWRGMTQREVADKAGVNRNIIQQWEAMTHVPKADQAIKVAKAMDLDFEDLFHDFEMQKVPRTTPLPIGRPKRKEKVIE